MALTFKKEPIMVQGYSRLQIILHWVIGVLILFNLLLSDDMTALWDAKETNPAATMTTGALLHIIVGSLILALVALRLVVRLTRGVPEVPESGALMELAGKVGHWALYALMIGLPVTGLLAFFGGVSFLAEVHGGILKALLWVLIAGHVAAALYHQFVRKDNLLDRMRTPK
jgi:cytochrome b561